MLITVVLGGLLAAGVAVNSINMTVRMAPRIIENIKGIINQIKLKMKLKDLGVEKAMVKKIDTCKNVVSVEDLNSGNEIEIHGDGIDDSVYVMQYY